ncbi:MAG: amidohydrolase family protein [Actinobacteria bacterium]|nr:amidohydrolase family protein [Actinomycetota bacterium]
MGELVAEVFDGERVRGLCRVRWRDGVIEEVAELAPDQAPDGPRRYLVPGLVDTHVHLLGFAGADKTRVDGFTWPLVTTREEQTLHVAANCRQALRRGVTTLRELSGDRVQVAVARAFDAGLLPGPRVLVGGPVGMTAGHGDLFTPPAVADRPPVADSPDECRKLVRTWARDGLHAIKIYTSGGVLSIGDQVGWRNQTRAELAATVDEAHALGMPVACHAHSAEGIAIALELGVDSLEHASQLTPAQADELAARGIPVAPTLLINDLIAAGRFGSSPEATAIAAELVTSRDERFADAARRGVDFVLGTDASGYFVRHGEQSLELQAMSRVFGWDAVRTLAAATSRAAAAIGLGERVGRVAVGLAADFVVTDAAPWEDLRVLDGDLEVVSRGAFC